MSNYCKECKQILPSGGAGMCVPCRQRDEIRELQRELEIEVDIRDAIADQCGELRAENERLTVQRDEYQASVADLMAKEAETQYLLTKELCKALKAESERDREKDRVKALRAKLDKATAALTEAHKYYKADFVEVALKELKA